MIFDPEHGFEPKFQVLKDYEEHYKKLKAEHQLSDYKHDYEEYH